MWFDVLLAAAVAVAEVIGALVTSTSTPVALRILVALVAAAGVLVRRRLPLVTLAAALVDTAVQAQGSVALPVAAYALTRYEPRQRVRVCGLVVAFGVLLRPWSADALQHWASAGLNASFLVLLPAALGAYVAARAQLVQALVDRAERAEAAQELLAHQAVLEERARIAREMHDVVGHRVSLLVLQAGATEMAAGDSARVAQLAGQMQDTGRRALDELRQMVGVLRTEDGDVQAPLTPQPRIADLMTLVAESEQAGMDVTVSTEGQPRPLDETVERAAFRVVQEALTNAGRHAPGAPVAVTLLFGAEDLTVRIVSRRPSRPPTPVDGAGSGGGVGLVSLRERAQAVGGELRAGARLDGGFMVEAVLPA